MKSELIPLADGRCLGVDVRSTNRAKALQDSAGRCMAVLQDATDAL